MMTYILHNNYILVQCIIIMTIFFLSMRGTRQQRHFFLLRPKSQVCPKSCTNIRNTHFTVIGIFYNNIMHTLPPSDLPPLSHGHVKTRGMGGEGRTDATGAVEGGRSGSSSMTSARKCHLLIL